MTDEMRSVYTTQSEMLFQFKWLGLSINRIERLVLDKSLFHSGMYTCYGIISLLVSQAHVQYPTSTCIFRFIFFSPFLFARTSHYFFLPLQLFSLLKKSFRFDSINTLSFFKISSEIHWIVNIFIKHHSYSANNQQAKLSHPKTNEQLNKPTLAKSTRGIVNRISHFSLINVLTLVSVLTSMKEEGQYLQFISLFWS